MNSGMDNFLNSASNLLEKAPQIYDDGLAPYVKEMGKTLALPPKLINGALLPLREWALEREYRFSEIELELEKKLMNTDPNKITTPELHIAIPAIQAISYSMNNEELRNLYANLLAKSMNSDTKDSVHPSFVEIIKQLSPLDAKIFKHLCMDFLNQANPIVNLRQLDKTTGGGVTVVRNLTLLNLATTEDIALSIDNLERLKLIEIPIFGSYTNEDLYTPFESLEITQKLKVAFDQFEHLELDIDKKTINITDLGYIFHRICVKES